jgi:flagellar operon protein
MMIDRVGTSVNGSGDINSRINHARGTGVNFGDLIRERVQPQELKFSAHAESRLKSRGIELTSELKDKLNRAVSNVAAKGGRDTAIFAGDSAFIVNVQNRTVVTAMDRESMTNNVITNIDSATMV